MRTKRALTLYTGAHYTWQNMVGGTQGNYAE